MKQILHIFAKDARHFWLESLLSAVMAGTYAWVTPSVWLSSNTLHLVAGGSFLTSFQEVQFLSWLLGLLLPISWWVLIARVIHAEPLVGDRQFWLTRPYEWKKLLSAKLFFLGVFLYLPLLAAQCWLLFQAGFAPLSYVPGLLFNLLMMTGILILPLLAITTVTATFAGPTVMLLAGLAIFIAYVTIAVVFFGEASLPVYGNTVFPLCLLICGIVVVLQYATRRVRLARLLLMALPVLLVLAGLAVQESAAINHSYAGARTAQDAPLQLAPLNDPKHPATTNNAPNGEEIQLHFPLSVSGVAQGYAIIPDQVRVTVDAPEGRHWTSPWQSIANQHYLPGSGDAWVNVALNRPFFESVQAKPVTLHFTFALTHVRAGKVTTIPLPTHDFSVPDFGNCSPQASDFSHGFSGISCRFALRLPRLTRLSIVWPDDDCSAASPTEPVTGVSGDQWVGNLENGSADFSISSVQNPSMGFSNDVKGQGEGSQPRHLCPGTPITFTQYNLTQRMQYELTISNFRLPNPDDAKVTSEAK